MKKSYYVPHNQPYIDSENIRAVQVSLNTRWLAQGASVEKFEASLCSYLNAGNKKRLYSVATSSGTAALYLALYGMGIQAGDEIILPTYTCSALLNAVHMVQAKPVLVDVDPDTWNISYESTLKAVTKKTKAIIVTHTFGTPVPLKRFLSLKIPVIEDCAQAFGASIKGQKTGTFAKVSIYSFYATKMMTTGQGGMVVSSNKAIINKIRDYREFDSRKSYYPRFNFQMTDFQAALGLSQLKKLNTFIAKRKKLISEFKKALKEKDGIKVQECFSDAEQNGYRFVLMFDKNKATFRKLAERKGVQCIEPISPFELLHRYLHLNLNDFPNAEKIAKSTLSIPVFPGLSTVQINRIKKMLAVF